MRAAPPACERLLQVGDTTSKLKHSAAALKCLQQVAPAAVKQVASLATMHAATLVGLLQQQGHSAQQRGDARTDGPASARLAGDVNMAAAMQAAGNARNVLALVYGEQHPRTQEAVRLYRMLATGTAKGGNPRVLPRSSSST